MGIFDFINKSKKTKADIDTLKVNYYLAFKYIPSLLMKYQEGAVPFAYLNNPQLFRPLFGSIPQDVIVDWNKVTVNELSFSPVVGIQKIEYSFPNSHANSEALKGIIYIDPRVKKCIYLTLESSFGGVALCKVNVDNHSYIKQVQEQNYESDADDYFISQFQQLERDILEKKDGPAWRAMNAESLMHQIESDKIIHKGKEGEMDLMAGQYHPLPQNPKNFITKLTNDFISKEFIPILFEAYEKQENTRKESIIHLDKLLKSIDDPSTHSKINLTDFQVRQLENNEMSDSVEKVLYIFPNQRAIGEVMLGCVYIDDSKKFIEYYTLDVDSDWTYSIHQRKGRLRQFTKNHISDVDATKFVQKTDNLFLTKHLEYQKSKEKRWDLMTFYQQFGRLQIGDFTNKKTNEKFKMLIFSNQKADKSVYVSFSTNVGELTSTELINRKNELDVVQLSNGCYIVDLKPVMTHLQKKPKQINEEDDFPHHILYFRMAGDELNAAQTKEFEAHPIIIPMKTINLADMMGEHKASPLFLKYNIMHLPTMILIDSAEKEIMRWEGFTTSKVINDYIEANGYDLPF